MKLNKVSFIKYEHTKSMWVIGSFSPAYFIKCWWLCERIPCAFSDPIFVWRAYYKLSNKTRVVCYHNSFYVSSNDVFVWMYGCSFCKWIEAVLRTRISNVWIMYVCVCNYDRNVEDMAIHGSKTDLNEHIIIKY